MGLAIWIKQATGQGHWHGWHIGDGRYVETYGIPTHDATYDEIREQRRQREADFWHAHARWRLRYGPEYEPL